MPERHRGQGSCVRDEDGPEVPELSGLPLRREKVAQGESERGEDHAGDDEERRAGTDLVRRIGFGEQW